uniref:DNA-directed RNA polymerase III subunit RPC3 n=1 Tax=Globodera rostochiensis TaxID=31243 RepID=A0A914HA73_GLORO
MSVRTVELCVSILEDHFGFYVSAVGRELLRQQLPLGLLAKALTGRVRPGEVKRSIAILDQHNLLSFESSARGVLYTVLAHRVLHLIRAPRSILIVKTLYSSGAAEAIFEDVLAQGRTSCSQCIRRVAKCMDNLPTDKVKEDFVRLAEAQIVIRCERIDEKVGDSQCPAFSAEPDPFLMPDRILDWANDGTTQSARGRITQNKLIIFLGRKRKAPPDGSPPTAPVEQRHNEDSDRNILWRINWLRMERFFRDELVLNALDNNNYGHIPGNSSNEPVDKQTQRVAQVLLKVGEVKSASIDTGQSSPISLQDVFRYVKEHDVELTREALDVRLEVLGKDSNNVVRRVGESGGGLYIINYEKGIEFLCNEHIESAIREKIGDKAVRIYRLLRSKGLLEEEQVEKEAMLSAKETKEMCCALMDHSFITVRQLARTNDFAPARTFFLYTVSAPQVLSAMVSFTTLALNNVIRRRMLEREKHEVLLDRQLKMEVILSNIANDANFDEESRKQQMVDVEQSYMTESDRRKLDRFRGSERRLFATEIELDKVMFTFQQYELLRRRWTLEQARQKPQGRRRRQPAPPPTTTATAATAQTTTI